MKRLVLGCLSFVAIPALAADDPLKILAQIHRASDAIPDVHAKAAFLQDVAVAQAAAGDIEAARRTVAGIPGEEGNWASIHALAAVALAQAAAGDDVRAHQTAGDIPNDSYYRAFYRAQVLTAVAALDAKSGKAKAAREAFRQAVELSSELSTEPGDRGTPRGAALKNLAKAQSEAGFTDDALHTAELLSDRERDSALVEVGRARAEAGDEAGARRATAALSDGDDAAVILVALAASKIHAGDKKDALRVLSQIPRSGGKRADLARVYAEAGDVPSALAAAGGQGEALAATVKILVRRGDSKSVKEIVSIAKAQDDPVSRRLSLRSENLEEIATAQAEAGDILGAHNTADGIGDEYWKGIALSAITKAEVGKGDTQGALRTASLIKDGNEQYEAYEPIARALVKAGDKPGALKLADSFGPEPVTLHARILAAIAETQAQMGDMIGARETVGLIQDDCVEGVGPVAAAEVGAGDAKGAVAWATAGGTPDLAILSGAVQGVRDTLKSTPLSRAVLGFKFIELSEPKGCY